MKAKIRLSKKVIGVCNPGIQPIYIQRQRLIRKERMENFYKNDDFNKHFSVNDDLESCLHDQKLDSEHASLILLPKLTTEELKLVRQKDTKFLDTFYSGPFADVDKDEMKLSESDSKFVFAFGARSTFTIEYQLPRRFPNSCKRIRLCMTDEFLVQK